MEASQFATLPSSQQLDVLVGLLQVASAGVVDEALRIYAETSTDPVLRLPEEVVILIFSILDPRSLCRAALVCRRWHRITNLSEVWRLISQQFPYRLTSTAHSSQLKERRYSHYDNVTGRLRVDWKAVVEARYKLRRNWQTGRGSKRTFEGHRQVVTCVSFDETKIASGSSDSTIRVWSTKTNASWSVLTLLGHSDAVRCLALRGNMLISGSSDHTIKVWVLEAGLGWSRSSCRLTIQSHTDAVRCLCLEADTIVSGSYDGTIQVHTIASGSRLQVFSRSCGTRVSISLSSQGGYGFWWFGWYSTYVEQDYRSMGSVY